MSGKTPEPQCWCEHVDIGVGMQKVAEHPECPRCVGPLPPEGGVTIAQLAAENRRLTGLLAAATEFTFLPDLAAVDAVDGVDAAEYAVRLGRGEQGRWYLTRGTRSAYGDVRHFFWDCTEQRFKSSLGISACDRVFFGFDGPIEQILDLQLPAALAAQVPYARLRAQARR